MRKIFCNKCGVETKTPIVIDIDLSGTNELFWKRWKRLYSGKDPKRIELDMCSSCFQKVWSCIANE